MLDVEYEWDVNVLVVCINGMFEEKFEVFKCIVGKGVDVLVKEIVFIECDWVIL